MSKEWKIGIAAALVVLSLLFLILALPVNLRGIGYDMQKVVRDQWGIKFRFGLDIKGGVQITLEAVPYENQTLTQNDVNQLKTVLENRINTLGLKLKRQEIIRAEIVNTDNRLLLKCF